MDAENLFLTENLPSLAAEKIASFLDGRDLINLGYTCKYWCMIANKSYVWKGLVRKRFGERALDGLETTEGGIEEFKKLYFKLASSKMSITKFYIMHLGSRYLERIGDDESDYGEVVRLNTVCWLQINSKFPGVLPGKYKLLWRMKLEDVYVNGDSIEFRAKPEDGCGTSVVSKWDENRLQQAEQRHGSDCWFIGDMGEFTVNTLCDVEVEIWGRVDYWCGGITWDTVQLKPVISQAQPEVSRKECKSEKRCMIS
jgi:hypothetical protein